MRRPKQSKLAACSRLRAAVEDKLEERWSPTQISGWLVEEFPDDAEMRVSHETIYLSLFVQSRGALRKELTRYLRSGHTTRSGRRSANDATRIWSLAICAARSSIPFMRSLGANGWPFAMPSAASSP